MLVEKENKVYSLGIPNDNQCETQVRLGKDRLELGKDRLLLDEPEEEPLNKYIGIINAWNNLRLAQIKGINSNRLKNGAS